MKNTLINFKSLLLATCMMLTVQSSNAQIQKGADIDGEAAGDFSGYSVSMPDANTLAIGAYLNNGNGVSAGHVRVYNWSGTAWAKKGADIDGEAADDYSGCSVSMPDANTLAIGAINNQGTAAYAGHVRVYNWSGTAWVKKGADIDAEATSDRSGFSVSMPDANTLAIGAINNEGNGVLAGHVRVYKWSGTAWVKKGADIDGEYTDNSGYSVSMPDANTLAIGAPFNNGNGAYAGHVRVYNWSGTAWVKKGADIDGEAAGDLSGFSVSMPDANTLAIGARANNGNGTSAGHVRIYNWSGTAWVKKGADIDGEAAGDQSGQSVSMPDANTLAIGAYENNGNGASSGHVRVYSISSLDVLENSVGNTLEIYPNPAKSVINVKTADTKLLGMAYSIYDNAGKVVLSGKITSENTSIELGNLAAGIYMLSIAENMSQTFKVIKRL